MPDIVKRHNFDQTLRKIQDFVNNTPTIPTIDKFETDGGLFGLGDHYINGTEMNRYVEKVQDTFRGQNRVLIQTIQEFRDIYKTFDYLDKEYLNGIIGAVEAATMASQGAKAASDQAKDAANRALKNERDIKSDVENLRKVVEKIKTIKEDLLLKISSLETRLSQSQENLRRDLLKRIPSSQDISILNSSLTELKRLNYISDIKQIREVLSKIDLRITELVRERDIIVDSLESNLLNIVTEQNEAQEKHSRQMANKFETQISNIQDSQLALDTRLKGLMAEQANLLRKEISSLNNLVDSTIGKLKKQLVALEKTFLSTIEAQTQLLQDEINKLKKESSDKYNELGDAVLAQEASLSDQIAEQNLRHEQNLENVSIELANTSQTLNDKIIELGKDVESKLSAQDQSHKEALNSLSEESVAGDNKLEDAIHSLDENVSNKIETLVSEIKKQNNSFQKQLIIAYVVGVLGIVGAVVSIFL